MTTMGAYTLNELLDDSTAKLSAIHREWPITADLLFIIWDHVFEFVENQLLAGKGVNVPNFGVFCLFVENINLGNREKTIKTPVFVVNETFGRCQDNKTAAKNIPLVQINHSQIALDSNTNRDVVVEFLKYAFRILGPITKNSKIPSSVELGTLATLTSSGGFLRVNFRKDLVASVRGSSGQTRPVTAANSGRLALDNEDPLSFSKSMRPQTVGRSSLSPQTSTSRPLTRQQQQDQQQKLNKSLDFINSTSRASAHANSLPRRSVSAGRERPSSSRRRVSSTTPSYMDDNYDDEGAAELNRRADLALDGVSVAYDTSNRPKNPARKTRPESPMSTGRSSTSSKSDQELCDMCKMSNAHDHARARNNEQLRQINKMHDEQEAANLRALLDREERDRQNRKAALLATQKANEELLRQKQEQQQRERLNDSYGTLIVDRTVTTPPHIRKERYKDALKEQMEEKNRTSAYQNEQKQREREREAEIRRQHAEDEMAKKEADRHKKEEHSRELMEQMRTKSSLANSYNNNNNSNNNSNNGADHHQRASRPGDEMNLLRSGRPPTAELKSKIKLNAIENSKYQHDTIAEKKRKEEEEKRKQMEQREQEARKYQEEKRRLEEEEHDKKLRAQNDLRKSWANQTHNKQNSSDYLLPEHTSLHMTADQIAEHLRHCKKCGKALGTGADFRRKSGDFRKTATRV